VSSPFPLLVLVFTFRQFSLPLFHIYKTAKIGVGAECYRGRDAWFVFVINISVHA